MNRWNHGLAVMALLAGVSHSATPVAEDGAAENWAEVIINELAQGHPMPTVSSYDGDLDLAAAYAVQREFVEASFAGRPAGGYKAGFTNKDAQRKFYLNGPVSGVLPSDGRKADGAVIDAAQFKNLMVEVEIGFVLRSPIRRAMKSIADLKTYVGAAVPAIELPDLYYEKPAALIGLDVVATNVAARAYIVGKPFVVHDLAEVNAVKVTLARDGQIIDEGMATNALGDQLEALLWLVNHLVGQGWPLYPGQVLITGALGKVNPGAPGKYHADYGGRATLDFEIRAAPATAAAGGP